MRIKKQFTLYLENRAGELARVTRKIALAGINLEGISVSASTDVGLVQMVVDNAVKTRKLLSAGKIPFSVQDVAVISLNNQPGALSDVVCRIARCGANINYVYATACECSEKCRCFVVISAPDLKQLKGLLE